MDSPRVSIIIRTCNRPLCLKRALQSIREQTYRNIEVVIVEDGERRSEAFLREEFQDLNIKYYCTEKSAGRTVVGNIGLDRAEGRYINFLDDDDLFYPEHVELLVSNLEKNQGKAAYSVAEESQIKGDPEDAAHCREKRKIVKYRQPFNRILLYHANYIPIQSIMFSRELYEQLGGLDESLETLEDWDLWVRYSTAADFIFVDRITSKYHVPYQRNKRFKRGRKLAASQKGIEEKFASYNVNMNVGRMYREMDHVVKVYKATPFKRYLRLIVDFLMYGER